MPSKTQKEFNPAALFEVARSYRIAADRLLAVMRTDKLPVGDPTYFLYSHAAELALKSLLLTHGLPVPTSGTKGHALSEIYEKCRDAKLTGLADPAFEMHNLICLLNSGNHRQRYRYSGKNERIRAGLDWACEVVEQLMQAVEPHVLAWIQRNSPPPENRCIAFGKPTYRKQPVPTNPGP